MMPLVQTDHAAHGIQTVHRAGVAAVVDDMVLTVHTNHAADDGNAQLAAAQLIGERLRGIRVLLRPQIRYHIHTGFQLAVREGVLCRTVKAACVQAVLNVHLSLGFTVAHNAARIRICTDGHVVGGGFRLLFFFAVMVMVWLFSDAAAVPGTLPA